MHQPAARPAPILSTDFNRKLADAAAMLERLQADRERLADEIEHLRALTEGRAATGNEPADGKVRCSCDLDADRQLSLQFACQFLQTGDPSVVLDLGAAVALDDEEVHESLLEAIGDNLTVEFDVEHHPWGSTTAAEPLVSLSLDVQEVEIEVSCDRLPRRLQLTVYVDEHDISRDVTCRLLRDVGDVAVYEVELA